MPRPNAEWGVVMLYVLSGVVVAGAGVGSLWYCRPHNGQVKSIALKPILEWLIPIGIVTALALGAALIVTGIVG
jgi:hypothetical protein